MFESMVEVYHYGRSTVNVKIHKIGRRFLTHFLGQLPPWMDSGGVRTHSAASGSEVDLRHILTGAGEQGPHLG